MTDRTLEKNSIQLDLSEILISRRYFEKQIKKKLYEIKHQPKKPFNVFVFLISMASRRRSYPVGRSYKWWKLLHRSHRPHVRTRAFWCHATRSECSDHTFHFRHTSWCCSCMTCLQRPMIAPQKLVSSPSHFPKTDSHRMVPSSGSMSSRNASG